MYYLKEQGFVQMSSNRLVNIQDGTEYTLEEGWYYIDQGDHYTMGLILN